MKKQNLKNLKFKKETISKIQEDNIEGGITTTVIGQTKLLCKSQIHQGEDNCVSIGHQ